MSVERWRVRCDAGGRESSRYYVAADGQPWEGDESSAKILSQRLGRVALWREYGYRYRAVLWRVV